MLALAITEHEVDADLQPGKYYEMEREDCMALMARYPDKYFDLAIVDPPYGLGEDGGDKQRRRKGEKPVIHFEKKILG
jgi:predicted TIM-barrel fold metal-dependent hydrolase